MCNTENSPGRDGLPVLQSPECDAVGSTTVVAIVTPDEIIVTNCGDSRTVHGFCFSETEGQPDRPDELERIHAAGGRVIYWDRLWVLGILRVKGDSTDNVSVVVVDLSIST
ncbi:hypothetical protein MLD38_040110 [Melastoma candidum]|uniref:Uncharacterized protein n=1 Tax=Melastoma candidum TaxID=119954 RepID=A0ACB9L471_9MYRT|nr:hypothetical protein MLD38_040110 [Melastoma candidum]